MNTFNELLKASHRVLVALLMLGFSCQVLAQGQSGPETPSVDGTSPLIGYLIAVVLMVLLVVVSIIPSKRHFEDI
ncbi:MAG: hypothetical protein MK082_01245 [Phycisphaerales bacterium]|nr:hypothetical protein [Phycisphaerales bacterium]